MTPRRRAGILLALGTAGISGVSVFVNSYGLQSFGNPTAYTTAKNVVAAVVLLGVVAAGARTGAHLSRPRSFAQWAGLAAVGVVGGSVPFVLFFEGLARATSVEAAFLHKTLILWVALLAVPLLGERLQIGHWVAVGLIVLGQVGLVGGVMDPFGAAQLMILAATLLWAGEVVLAKWLLADVSSWTVGVTRMGVGSVVLLGWVAVRGDLGLLLTPTGEQAGWVLLTGLLLAAYVGTWLAALARAQAVDVTAVLVLAVPLTSMLDALVKGTPLSPQLGWLALVVAGGTLAAGLGWRTGSPTRVPAGT
jgi:drug/metabolite transporter (DMT)-like permease